MVGPCVWSGVGLCVCADGGLPAGADADGSFRVGGVRDRGSIESKRAEGMMDGYEEQRVDIAAGKNYRISVVPGQYVQIAIDMPNTPPGVMRATDVYWGRLFQFAVGGCPNNN